MPEIYVQAKKILDSRHASQSGLVTSGENTTACYLSREGFNLDSRVSNRDEVLGRLTKIYGQIDQYYPHKHSLGELYHALQKYSCVVSEPGTTPLIAYLISSQWTNFYTMASSRCISQCDPRFYYSGWRYHLAYANHINIFWGKPWTKKLNPFADNCYFPVEYLF